MNAKEPQMKLFSLSSNRPLAEKIAGHLGIELGAVKIETFSDGEIHISVEESIRGDEIFIIQSTSAPVNDHLMELLIMVDALRRASAGRINVVMPYYGYARQDRKSRSREPITAKLVANLLEKVGVDRMMTLDLHAAQIQGFFDIPVDHMLGTPLLANYFLEHHIQGEDVVIVSPDHGGVTRARKLAGFLHSPLAIVDKRRPRANVAEVMNVIGNVDGKTAILIDDMIDTAGTITAAASALKDLGASEVYAAGTHAVLSGPSIQRLESSEIKNIILTDSILLPKEKQIDKIIQVSVAELISDAIRRVYHNTSVSPLFEAPYHGKSEK